MGNIYFKQKNFQKAIKFYRMALDQVPNTHKEMRSVPADYDFLLVPLPISDKSQIFWQKISCGSESDGS